MQREGIRNGWKEGKNFVGDEALHCGTRLNCESIQNGGSRRGSHIVDRIVGPPGVALSIEPGEEK